MSIDWSFINDIKHLWNIGRRNRIIQYDIMRSFNISSKEYSSKESWNSSENDAMGPEALFLTPNKTITELFTLKEGQIKISFHNYGA